MKYLSKEQLLGRRAAVNYVILINFLLLTASRFIYPAITDRDSEYIVVPILQMLIFVLPAMMFLWQSGGSSMSRARLRLRIPRASHIPVIASATVMLTTGGLLLSMIFGGMASLRSNFSLYELFVSKNGGTANDIYLVFTYALGPAVCEEMTYRSLLCSEYEDRGVLATVAVSSLLFGIFSFNIQMLPTYVFAGILLALIMYATHSVICSIAVHFLYNLFCIFTQPRVATFYETTSSRGLFISITILLFMLSATVFCFSAGKLYLKYAKSNKAPTYPTELTPREQLNGFLDTVCNLPAILCILIYIITIVLIK